MSELTNRYFVDARCGCIAVRDRTLTDPEYPGLHSDTEGVVKYWHGVQFENVCGECRHVSSRWGILPWMQKEADELAATLNAEQTP